MTVSYFLDGDVFMWAARGHAWALDLLHGLGGATPAISAITVFELTRALSPEQHERIAHLVSRCDVVPLTAEVARDASAYCTLTAIEGYRADYFAGIVAATAAHVGRSLVTVNPFRYPLASCPVIPVSGLIDGAPDPGLLRGESFGEMIAPAGPSASAPVRTDLNVRELAVCEQQADGRWRARLDALDVSAEGDSEGEARRRLEEAVFESLATSAVQRQNFQRLSEATGDQEAQYGQ